MGSGAVDKTTLRALKSRIAALCAALVVVAVVVLLADDEPGPKRWRNARWYGACPAAGSIPPPTRRGAVITSRRPVLRGKPCQSALRAVDAGYCVDEPGRPLRCLPSFIIAGAQKAATGYLRQRLAVHPALAQGGGKEVHYFDAVARRDLRKTWRTSYLDNFAAPDGNAVTYEKTPDYMPNATAMRFIYELTPSAKLIFLLRNPTPRAYSAYQHHCRKGRFFEGPVFSLETATPPAGSPLPAPCASSTFDEFLRVDGGAFRAETRLVSWGLYADQLAAIRRVGFRDPDLLVIFSEPALRDAARLLDFVVAWLGLARFDFARLRTYRDALGREQLRAPGPLGWAHAFYDAHNSEMVRRHTAEPASAAARRALDDHYRRPNRLLDMLLRTARDVAVYPPRAGNGTLLPGSWSS